MPDDRTLAMVRVPAMLSLVAPSNRVTSQPEAEYPFTRTPLVVAFATDDALDGVKPEAPVGLSAVPAISSDDAYLLLPRRAREGLLRAFARGELGVVTAWFARALVLRAELERVRAPRLWVGDVWSAREVMLGPAAATVNLSAERDPVRVVNALPWVAGLARGGLLDEAGASTLVTRGAYVGVSRVGLSALGLGRDAVEPTYLWSERDERGVAVRVAIAAEDDDEGATCLLAPVSFEGVS